jgi:uncharacterized protein (TIGR03118 family)
MEAEMKVRIVRKSALVQPKTQQRLALCAIAACLALACVTSFGKSDKDNGNNGKHKGEQNRATVYQQVNLVSDQSGVALLQDTNLVNAWGISFSSTSPFWVSSNGKGLATLYAVTNDSSGMVHVAKQALEVTIPGDGTPTGQLFNGSGSFNGDVFIFASEDGTISGWRPALGTSAEVLTNRSTAVYKGITLVTSGSQPMLLAANFAEATVDVYGTNAMGLVLLGQFSDSDAPAGYAPFNVQKIGHFVFVTFALQNDAKHDDVAGTGHGLIDIFNPNTGVFKRFATGSDAGGKLKEINSPWGLVLSPDSFGKHSDQLLVGNFGSGTIMAFDEWGKFKGLLKSAQKGPVMIDGLWALTFGNGGRGGDPNTLYFSAGPDKESNGLFGSLSPVKPGKGHDHEDDEDDD